MTSYGCISSMEVIMVHPVILKAREILQRIDADALRRDIRRREQQLDGKKVETKPIIRKVIIPCAKNY